MEPWEGVTGQVRDDYLLSLDERAQAHREALIAAAKRLRQATLVGNQAPVVRGLWERLSHPVPGDLVVECSRAIHSRRDDDRWKGLGILLAHRDEPDEPDVYYVQYGPRVEDVARWANSQFMALPASDNP